MGERPAAVLRWANVASTGHPNTMKIGVVGSREFASLASVAEWVNALPEGSVVVSGGGRGVDLAAEVAARTRGLPVIIYPAEWDKHGRGAGFIRNQLIVNEADIVFAFWDGKSRGTADTIARARKAGKPVTVFAWVDGIGIVVGQ